MPTTFAGSQVALELVASARVLVLLAFEPPPCFVGVRLHSCRNCSFAQALRRYRESSPLVLLEVVATALRVPFACFLPSQVAIEHRAHVSVH